MARYTALEKIVKIALIRNDMLMGDLAIEMNVRRERIYQILKLQYRPTGDVILNLALALNLPVKEIQDAIKEELG